MTPKFYIPAFMILIVILVISTLVAGFTTKNWLDFFSIFSSLIGALSALIATVFGIYHFYKYTRNDRVISSLSNLIFNELDKHKQFYRYYSIELVNTALKIDKLPSEEIKQVTHNHYNKSQELIESMNSSFGEAILKGKHNKKILLKSLGEIKRLYVELNAVVYYINSYKFLIASMVNRTDSEESTIKNNILLLCNCESDEHGEVIIQIVNLLYESRDNNKGTPKICDEFFYLRRDANDLIENVKERLSQLI